MLQIVEDLPTGAAEEGLLGPPGAPYRRGIDVLHDARGVGQDHLVVEVVEHRVQIESGLREVQAAGLAQGAVDTVVLRSMEARRSMTVIPGGRTVSGGRPRPVSSKMQLTSGCAARSAARDGYTGISEASRP
jgi:hypothetical protein